MGDHFGGGSRPMPKSLGWRLSFSDDNESYSVATAELGLSHQLCIAHVRKCVTRRVKFIYEQAEKEGPAQEDERLEKLRGDPEVLKGLLKELPEEGAYEIGRLHRGYPCGLLHPRGKGHRQRKSQQLTGCGCTPYSCVTGGTRYVFT
jgi:hypothetical protein